MLRVVCTAAKKQSKKKNTYLFVYRLFVDNSIEFTTEILDEAVTVLNTEMTDLVEAKIVLLSQVRYTYSILFVYIVVY